VDGGRLTLKQEKFAAAYIGIANGNATEAARQAGYAGSDATLGVTGHDLIKNPKIAARIDAYRAEIKRQGIAHKQNRLDAYDDRWQRMGRMIEARADYFKDDPMPDARLGLMVKRLKRVSHYYEPSPDPDAEDQPTRLASEEVWEYETDTGLLKELREVEKQAAQEVGDWTERRELAGPNGGAIPITGVEVPLPTRADDPPESAA
jgi:hypothetical protein